MNIEQKRERVKELKKQAAAIKLQIRELENEIAEEICPLKIGNVIESRGRRGRITSIYSLWSGDRSWTASAVRIRKDGSDGATFTISHYESVEILSA